MSFHFAHNSLLVTIYYTYVHKEILFHVYIILCMQFLMRVQTVSNSISEDVKHPILPITYTTQWPNIEYSQAICFVLFSYNTPCVQCMCNS